MTDMRQEPSTIIQTLYDQQLWTSIGGLVDARKWNLREILGFVSAAIVTTIGNNVRQLVAACLGKTTEQEWMLRRREQRQQRSDGGGFFGAIMERFVDFLEQNATAVSADPPDVTTGVEERRALFAGLIQNISSILWNAAAPSVA